MKTATTSIDFKQALFSPRAVALVGASGNLQKNTARPMRFRRKHGFAGQIYPINRTQSEIMGARAYADLSELPDPTIYSDGFRETGQAKKVIAVDGLVRLA